MPHISARSGGEAGDAEGESHRAERGGKFKHGLREPAARRLREQQAARDKQHKVAGEKAGGILHERGVHSRFSLRLAKDGRLHRAGGQNTPAQRQPCHAQRQIHAGELPAARREAPMPPPMRSLRMSAPMAKGGRPVELMVK